MGINQWVVASPTNPPNLIFQTEQVPATTLLSEIQPFQSVQTPLYGPTLSTTPATDSPQPSPSPITSLSVQLPSPTKVRFCPSNSSSMTLLKQDLRIRWGCGSRESRRNCSSRGNRKISKLRHASSCWRISRNLIAGWMIRFEERLSRTWMMERLSKTVCIDLTTKTL